MSEDKIIRDKWLTVRLSEEEESRINSLRGKTTAKSLSEYARSILLREPVIVTHRNASADDFLVEMIRLKNELNAIGHNFNQVVKKLHSLDHDHEIKSWAVLNESARKRFAEKVEEIQEKINEIHLRWSQE
ncbi:MAG: plasmid mobilization relaxosome protein MobC [Bacteroidota bacterium]